MDEISPLYKAAYYLLQRLWQNSICISMKELHLLVPDFNVDDYELGKDKPIVFDGEFLYVQRYFVYQTTILKRIENLVEKEMLHIITGGPGTGKTTSLSDILKNETSKKILLAAPTGKAAFRMTESLASKGIYLKAKTIHRLLGYIPFSINFRHNKDKPLDADIIAIDECSMIDIPMMAKLLDATPENCHLYLLGDKNQLSPVAEGTVFADICKKYMNYGKNIYNELTKIYRTDCKGIIELSSMILNGKVSNFCNDNVTYSPQISFDDLFAGYNALLSTNDVTEALKYLQEFQVLCAIKNGKNGTKNINKTLLTKAINNGAMYVPIIITENNYTLNLFNGDVGVRTEKMAYLLVENEIKEYPLSSLPSYDDAFAITIHKSQGSEYKKIAVVYPKEESENNEQTIFTRELLYTAITRAKNECLIYGGEEVLLKSCERQIHRASGIK